MWDARRVEVDRGALELALGVVLCCASLGSAMAQTTPAAPAPAPPPAAAPTVSATPGQPPPAPVQPTAPPPSTPSVAPAAPTQPVAPPVAPQPAAAPAPAPAAPAPAPAPTGAQLPPGTTIPATSPVSPYSLHGPPAPPSAAPPSGEPVLDKPPAADHGPRPLRTPFFDLQLGGIDLRGRFENYDALWAQVGFYAAQRFRVAVRVGAPRDNARDKTRDALPAGYQQNPIGGDDPPDLYGNPTLGYVFTDDGSFVVAPSLSVLITNRSRYGYGAGVMFPFVWVTKRGFRVGFEVSALMGFGGSIRGECVSMATPPTCDVGEVRAFDRSSASGFSASFSMGYGANVASEAKQADGFD